ncbi:MAG: polymer-forming cytoskeletal protein [Hyphomicrobium sp.]|jgi:cytoskeletal protein CcmA (bactofilin family)|nr:polymer-forming cytoskeletal protein [Hyphomicrobium sp.]
MTVSLSSDALEATPVPDNDEPVVIRPNTSVLGCLTIDGDAIIHGQVDGELRADNVFIAKSGMVLGTIVAGEVVVEGSALEALVFADRIVLRPGSQTTGEIWHKELVLEAGHLFEGKSRRHSEPRSLAPNDADDRED